MAIRIQLVKNNIRQSRNCGKYLAKAVSQGEVTVSDLARELKRDGLSQGTVEGVIIDLGRAVQHALADGKTVVLPRLGRFSLRVESDCVGEPADFDIARHIRRVVCRYLPAGTRNHQRNGTITQALAEGVTVDWQKGSRPQRNRKGGEE